MGGIIEKNKLFRLKDKNCKYEGIRHKIYIKWVKFRPENYLIDGANANILRILIFIMDVLHYSFKSIVSQLRERPFLYKRFPNLVKTPP